MVRQSARAVSAVIGVILMIAITVPLAATAATFFLGFEDRMTAEQPAIAVQGEFDADSGGHEMGIEFTGGDVVQSKRVSVAVRGADCLGAGTVSDRFALTDLGVSASEVAAGTRADVTVRTICPLSASQLDLSRTEIVVSWTGTGTVDGTVLYQWKGPAA
jgi:flagellin-like protein